MVLSALAVWLVLLDVRPERIPPGRPQDNGRQERLHRTLKADCATPPADSLRAQQDRFRRFRRLYNEERPHQALGDRTPASVYAPSPRAMPVTMPREPQYPGWVQRRWVDQRGLFRWRNGLVEVGRVLAEQRVGIQYLDPAERYWRLFLGKLPLAVWDEHYATWLSPKQAAEQVANFPEDPPWHW
jgi:hypothetical protein